MPLRPLLLLTALALALPAAAETQRRYATDVTGDFILIGNTLGQTCGSPRPTVGTVGACVERSRLADLSPDLFWRAETSSAVANVSVTPDRMRSTAMLTLPTDARIKRAYLYWWGEVDDVVADADVVLERPGVALSTFTATRSDASVQLNVDAVQPTYAETLNYLSVTDVSSFVATHGSGPYRVSGVGAHPLNDNFNIAYAGWAIVVIYERPGDPPRNIALFDGLERAVSGTVGVSLSGFQVPQAMFDGKLGVVGLDGEIDGAQLRFGPGVLSSADALSNALNPANRFFNGTRSYLGRAVSTAGDLPRTTGAPNSLGGVDFDVVDVTARLTPGQTAAHAEIAAGPNDGIASLIWVISLTTFRPDLEDLEKSVVDLNGGVFEVGDELEYSVRLHNRGNDAATEVVLSDVLPPGLAYQAGTLTLTSSATSGALTDAAGDDAGEYDAASRTVRIRLGQGATAAQGGRIPVGEGATLRFRARIEVGSGGLFIANQASVVAGGTGGAPPTTTLSDGVAVLPGDQATVFAVEPEALVDAGTIDDAGFDDAGLVDAGFLEDAEALPDAVANADALPAADATTPDSGARADAGLVVADAGLPVEPTGCSCQGSPGPTFLTALSTLWLMRRARRRDKDPKKSAHPE